jgi:imidazolonepropionase-like amidohydrolase
MPNFQHRAALLAVMATSTALAAPTVVAQSTSPVVASTVIRDVTVIDVVTGDARPGITVVIAGSRIQRMGRADEVGPAAGAREVNGRGQFLIPGLWDMHVHLGNATEAALPVLVAAGVTGVRDMGSPSFETLRRWSVEALSGARVGPRIVAAGPMLTAGTPQFWQLAVRGAANARRAVDSLAAVGVDFIKITQDLDRDTYFAVADEARRLGLPLVGHLPVDSTGVGFAVSAVEASNAGQKSLEHMHGIPFSFGAADSTLVSVLLRNGTWVTPTLTAFRARARIHELAATRDDRLRRIAPSLKQHWDAQVRGFSKETAVHRKILEWRMSGVRTLSRAGIPLLAGTDLGFPFVFPGDVVSELELFADAGLSPLEALRTATINPARFLDREKEFGSVDVGKVADLVLLDANPLDDVRNLRRIHTVVLNGRVLERAQLDATLPSF